MELKYGLNSRPAFGAMILYGLQWLMIAIPVVLTSTFVAPAGEMVCFTQKMFAVMGATMIVQVLWGHRMPLVAGPAAVLLMGVLTASAQGFGSDSIYPSIIIGGVMVGVIAASGVLTHLQRIFTPRVVVSILLLIAFTVAKPIVGMIFSDTEHPLFALAFAIVGVAAMAVANNLLRGVWKSSVVIFAMILGSVVYYCVTGFPSQLVADSAEFHLFNTPMRLDAGVVVAFVFCYIALFINEIGSVQSLGEMLSADGMARRNRRGLAVTGIMNIVAGACGVLGPVDYSLSPGVVASTSCASRYTMIPAAVAMIVLALFPQCVAVLLTIPQPVMGMVMLYLMATQIAAGLNMIVATRSVGSFREGMILGIPIMLTVILSFAPAEAVAAIPSLVRPIVGNGFVMGIIVILVLEHWLLRRGRE